MVQVVCTEKAPKAIGPYSQAIKANGFVFVSGQIPIDPESGHIVEGDTDLQTRRVLTNLSAILEESGSSLTQVVKTTVFLKDMLQFQVMNEVYGEFFSGHKPARSTIEVARLPRDVSIEIEAIALCD